MNKIRNQLEMKKQMKQIKLKLNNKIIYICNPFIHNIAILKIMLKRHHKSMSLLIDINKFHKLNRMKIILKISVKIFLT